MTLIAEKFNASNRSEFESLASRNLLTEVTHCTPTGRLIRLTVRDARFRMDAGENVYANVIVPDCEDYMEQARRLR